MRRSPNIVGAGRFALAMLAAVALGGCVLRVEILPNVRFGPQPDTRPASAPAGRTDYHGQWLEMTR